ncbi:MAG: 2-amino-4-hydroxy-6-hydroxymethyldihydropteridine diphosphokinase [Gammaproteobacteria bacterium]|nr:2-amino-4-hydroxy-6-hydroxymethyldihydropteridine diphosphokinase [Gammaproteobacteria bacterium]
MVECYIALGSNLQQPEEQLKQAILALNQLPKSRFVVASSLYGSAPMGPQDQPDYVNAVAKIETSLAPLTLLDQLQALEMAFGRVKSERWGARVLDLDLLLYGDQIIDHPRLKVPHVGIAQRAFVLLPLSEIVDELFIPKLGRFADLLLKIEKQTLWRLPDESNEVKRA